MKDFETKIEELLRYPIHKRGRRPLNALIIGLSQWPVARLCYKKALNILMLSALSGSLNLIQLEVFIGI